MDYELLYLVVWPRMLDLEGEKITIKMGTLEWLLNTPHILKFIHMYFFHHWVDIIYTSLVLFLPEGRNVV